MGGGKERVPPGCLSPGASLRVVGVFYRGMGDMRVGLGVALVGLVVCAGCRPGPTQDTIDEDGTVAEVDSFGTKVADAGLEHLK